MIRPFCYNDTPSLHTMLSVEGIEDKEMTFIKESTWVYEDEGVVKGFYTYCIENYFPHLIHFCVDRKYRSGNIARALIKDFKKRMMLRGYLKAIIHAKTTEIERIVSRYLKTKPYTKKYGMNFFL